MHWLKLLSGNDTLNWKWRVFFNLVNRIKFCTQHWFHCLLLVQIYRDCSKVNLFFSVWGGCRGGCVTNDFALNKDHLISLQTLIELVTSRMLYFPEIHICLIIFNQYKHWFWFWFWFWLSDSNHPLPSVDHENSATDSSLFLPKKVFMQDCPELNPSSHQLRVLSTPSHKAVTCDQWLLWVLHRTGMFMQRINYT